MPQKKKSKKKEKVDKSYFQILRPTFNILDLLLIPACIAAFTTGMTFAWSAPVLETLLSKDSPIPMTPDEGSWMVAIIELGNYLSPIPAGYLVNRIGRKWSLLLTGRLWAQFI